MSAIGDSNNATDLSDTMDETFERLNDFHIDGGDCHNTSSRSTQELITLFECPVCFEHITPPILQCTQGHLICASCKLNVNRCPTCREDMGSSCIRSLAMERVSEFLRFPCRYSAQGCTQMLLPKVKPLHENRGCPYRLFECPYRFIDHCIDWCGPKDRLQEHLITCHKDNFKREHGILEPHQGSVFQFNPFVNVVDYSCDQGSTSWMWTALQQAWNRVFVINLYYIFNGQCNVHILTVRLIGTVQEASKFKYQARLESGCGTRVWSYTDECRSMHEDMKEIYEKRECLHFDSSTARSFKFEVSHRSCSSTSENEQRDRETKQVLQFKISLFRAGGSSADRSLMGPLSLQHCQSSGTIGGSSAPTSAAPSTRASPLL